VKLRRAKEGEMPNKWECIFENNRGAEKSDAPARKNWGGTDGTLEA